MQAVHHVPFLRAKKGKRPHPGTLILSQIPEGGEGNRGQMPHICPGSTSLGLNMIEALHRNNFLSLCLLDCQDVIKSQFATFFFAHELRKINLFWLSASNVKI